MMAEETWFTPQEAKDAGLCDEIAGDAKADQPRRPARVRRSGI
jgi:ATP-dependent protease ClpP protease subunit